MLTAGMLVEDEAYDFIINLSEEGLPSFAAVVALLEAELESDARIHVVAVGRMRTRDRRSGHQRSES